MVGNIPNFLKCALSANLLNKHGREDARKTKYRKVLSFEGIAKAILRSSIHTPSK